MRIARLPRRHQLRQEPLQRVKETLDHAPVFEGDFFQVPRRGARAMDDCRGAFRERDADARVPEDDGMLAEEDQLAGPRAYGVHVIPHAAFPTSMSPDSAGGARRARQLQVHAELVSGAKGLAHVGIHPDWSPDARLYANGIPHGNARLPGFLECRGGFAIAAGSQESLDVAVGLLNEPSRQPAFPILPLIK